MFQIQDLDVYFELFQLGFAGVDLLMLKFLTAALVLSRSLGLHSRGYWYRRRAMSQLAISEMTRLFLLPAYNFSPLRTTRDPWSRSLPARLVVL